MHLILICYCRSQIFEISHNWKEFIGHLYVVIFSCILSTRREHVLYLGFSVFIYISSFLLATYKASLFHRKLLGFITMQKKMQ